MSTTKSLADLQIVVTKTILIASGILFFAIFLSDIYMGFLYLALIKLPIILIYVLAIYKLKISGFKERYTHFVFLPIIISLGINYLTNQGTDGPTLLGSLGLFVAYQIILEKRWSLIYSIVTILVFLTLLYFGMDKGNLIVADYAGAFERLLDHSVTYVLMAVYISLVVGMVLSFYKKQNQQLLSTQKQLEEHITLLKAEKKQKENLLGVLAHDVRNPVHSLGQLIMLYKENALNKLELSDTLNHMQVRITDLQVTIENILDDIRSNLDGNPVSKVPAKPIDVTRTLIQTLNYKLEAKNQKLVFEHPENTKYDAQFDHVAAEVSIIVKNLLDNASKYSPEGAQITLRIRETGTLLQWEVTDQGPGVSMEVQKILFTREIKSAQGAGVGLLLCKSISDTIGADLSYTPQAQGSLFQLALKY